MSLVFYNLKVNERKACFIIKKDQRYKITTGL